MSFKVKYSAKKTIALSFLLFAGTTLLAHAFIPHHHHDDDHPISQCDATQHRCVNDCSLENIYVKFDNDKPVFQVFDFNFNLLSYFFTLLPDYSILPVTINIGLPFRQNPYLSSYRTGYVSQSIGLRAPPCFN